MRLWIEEKRKWQQEGDNDETRPKPLTMPTFSLFRDKPWLQLDAPSTIDAAGPSANTSDNDDDADVSRSKDGGDTAAAETCDNGKTPKEEADPADQQFSTSDPNGSNDISGDAKAPLKFSGTPVRLSVFNECTTLTLLLGGIQAPDELELQSGIPLDEGLVFGRLPIFGPPPDVEDGDDEDDMDEEASSKVSNERFESYRKEFGMVDRYFLGEAIRDIVISHESIVTDAGVELGSAKHVAEQVWSTANVVGGKKGTEYSMIETLLSLMVQSSPSCRSPLRLIYLSRVLLELTRLAPTLISPAIAMAVSNMFQDYLPSLVPVARSNFSRWFAFHLINTDYQWPSGYWEHWAPYASYGPHNSRGSFLRETLMVMGENVCCPDLLVRDCLPKDCPLGDCLVENPPSPAESEGDGLVALQTNIKTRIWDGLEDAGLLLAYLTGDEARESVSTALQSETQTRNRSWWRVRVTARALMSPASEEWARIYRMVESARHTGLEDDDRPAEDSMAKILDTLRQYRALLLGVIAKDAEGVGGEAEHVIAGEIFLLEQVESTVPYSRALLDACLQSLLQNDAISSASIFHWSLGDCDDGTEDTSVVVRWWELAELAIQHTVTQTVSNSKNGLAPMDEGDESQMSDTPLQRMAKALIDQLEPLLSYCVRRVCTLLTGKDTGANRLSPEQVDLVEGVKYIAARTRSVYLSTLAKEKSETDDDVDFRELFSQSGAAGPNLSLHCSGGGASVELLNRILMQL